MTLVYKSGNICMVLIYYCSCRFCTVWYVPPLSPDRCWNAQRTCHNSTNFEVKKLCERGPANYITVKGRVYRNQFCAMCNNIPLNNVTQPKISTQHYERLNLWWQDNKLQHQNIAGKILESSTTLMAVKIKLSKQQKLLETNSGRGNNFNSDVHTVCSMFGDSKLDFCRTDNVTIIQASVRGSNETPVWDLNSLNCYSPNPKVCDLFAVSPAGVCGLIGCGEGQILDLETLECVQVLHHKQAPAVGNQDFVWHSHDICAYTSLCKSVEMGLRREEELNCYCDQFCIHFDDCCQDSPYQTSDLIPALPQGSFSCVDGHTDQPITEENFQYGVMEVNKCPPAYTNQSVINLCHARGTSTFSLTNVPVSDVSTGLR